MAIVALEALTFGLNRLAQASKKHGEDFYLLTGNRAVYQYELEQDSEHLINIVDVDTFDVQAVKQAIQSIAGVKAILNLTDTWSIKTIELSQELGLPCQNPRAVKLARNKNQFRDFLYQNRLTSSASLTVNPNNPPADLGQKLSYPVIVKDSSGTGSMNVWIAHDEVQLREIIKLASQAQIKGDNVLIEPFFHGALYSAETITWQGQSRIYAITSRVMSSEPHFREEAMAVPVQFSSSTQKTIDEKIATILSVMGYDHGMAHIEFVMTPHGLEIIEINPRVAGAQVTESICQAYDYNVLESYIEMALGKRPQLMDLPLTCYTGVGTVMVYANSLGKFSHIEGLERLRHHTSQPVFYPIASRGKPIDSLSDQTACVGIVMAYGNNSEQALLNVLAVKNHLSVFTTTE